MFPEAPYTAASVKELHRLVRRIEIRSRRMASDLFSGEYRSVFRGRGVEASGIREYSWGDDVRTIDWNASARKDGLYVREYAEERERTLMLCIDVSSSMMFGSRARLKLELAAELSALLGFSAIMNHDQVGLLLFSDRVERYISPAKGRRHLLALIEELLRHRPRQCSATFDVPASFIRAAVIRPAIVFVVSDLDAAGRSRPLQMLQVRHDVALACLQDPLEERMLPGAIYRLKDPETATQLLFDARNPSSLERYREYRQQQFARLEEEYRRKGIDILRLRTDRPVSTSLNQFFLHRAST